MMSRCVIVGGADIGNYPYIRSLLQEDDFFIFCDSGLKHLAALGTEANLIVGDFDSHPQPETHVETLVLPCEKDDTDTVYAVKEALRRGFAEFLLIGVVGGRLDHSLGNVSILLYLASLGKHGVIVDDYSEMELVGQSAVSVADRYAFFSLLNISGIARGVTITDAKYPLQNAEITTRYQFGVSNEVLPGKTASIRVEEGELLLIKVRS